MNGRCCFVACLVVVIGCGSDDPSAQLSRDPPGKYHGSKRGRPNRKGVVG